MHRKYSHADILNARKAASNGNNTLLDAVDWSYKFNNLAIFGITKCKDMPEYISQQNLRWVAHVCRTSNDTLTKQLMFPDVRFCKVGYRS